MIRIIETKLKGRNLVVVVGADDPSELDTNKAIEVASKEAKRKGYKEALDLSSIRTFGQNNLAKRKFYYGK